MARFTKLRASVGGRREERREGSRKKGGRRRERGKKGEEEKKTSVKMARCQPDKPKRDKSMEQCKKRECPSTIGLKVGEDSYTGNASPIPLMLIFFGNKVFIVCATLLSRLNPKAFPHSSPG